MLKQLLFMGGALSFLLVLVPAAAQTLPGNQSVGGDLTVNGWSRLKERTVYQDAGGVDWTVQSAGRALNFYPYYNYAGPAVHFYPNAKVAFPDKVSIGLCLRDSDCPNPDFSTLGSAFLVVGGPIAARGKISVIGSNSTNWPDYVFQRSYRLRPLAEVSRFIQLNHHLPDVPSAAQVQAEGVELVAMNATLLKKIEELTLYLLQLQAANQALTERVAKLEATK